MQTGVRQVHGNHEYSQFLTWKFHPKLTSLCIKRKRLHMISIASLKKKSPN